MNNIFRNKLVVVFYLVLLASLAIASGAKATVYDIFYKLNTGSALNPTSVVVNPPGNYPYSGAAPLTGTTWNQVDRNTLIPNNTVLGSTTPYSANNQAAGGVVLDGAGNTLSGVALAIAYSSASTSTGSRTEPSTGSAGENTIQPGGVLANTWRAYYGGANGFIYTFSGLPASTPFDLYFYGASGTSSTSAGGALFSLLAAYTLGANPTNLFTYPANAANSAGSYGAIWTGTSPNYTLMASNTWMVLHGQTDASGNFAFKHTGGGNGAYCNGFQLVRVPISTYTVTGGGTDCTSVAVNLSGSETNASYALYDNGALVAGSAQSGTGSSLSWTATASGIYTVVGTITDGISTGMSATMTGTASVTISPPTTVSLVSPPYQGVQVGASVTMLISTGGTSPTNYVWEKDGVPVTDGPTGNGSFYTGSATAALSITNAPAADSGTDTGQGYTCTVPGGCGSPTSAETLLLVTTNQIPPEISGLTDQTVVAGNTATFSAFVTGVPTPTLQWQVNAVNIAGAANLSLILPNVQYSQNGYIYSLVASNIAGVAVSNATLYVLVPPAIQQQPQSLVVTNTQQACFSVVSTNGVPSPSFQWYFNNTPISGATGSTFCITSAMPTNIGTYYVAISNSAGTVTSTNATLIVNSTMAAVSLSPTNGATTGVCYDTPLYITFNQAPLLRSAGQIRIYATTNTVSPVDTLDMSLNLGGVTFQPRTVAGETLNTYPVIITSNQAAIYPHLDLLGTNQTYYVTIDNGVFTDTNGAYFAGVTGSNTWKFTTKPTGPANPTNIVVAADGSGDFVTVQGAVDYVPSPNNTYRLINVHNGNYVEIVDINSGKSNVTFRGQSRTGVVVGYANNAGIASGGSTHTRMAFKVNTGNIAIENLTVLNRTPNGGGQAEALLLDSSSQRFILNNAEVDSYQDTVLGGQGYFNNSLIQGNEDYIWGGLNLFATNCEIRSLAAGGNITQCRSTPLSNGIAFVNYRVTGASNSVVNVTLGRAIGVASSTVAYVSCLIDTNTISGWTTGDVTNTALGLRWWEYGNSNLTATAAAVFNGTQLTNGDANLACAQSAPCWLYGWTPQLAPNILTNPVSMTVTAGVTATFSVAATGIPDPSYQWLLNGTNVINATSSTLTISNALAANAGTYAVIVSNIAGAVTSTNATLTIVGTAPTASFTASPTSGTEPLGVTFTDTSSGSPNITLFWDFGDSSQATNAGGFELVHTYAAGTYTVTLTASNAFGPVSTLVSNGLVNVLTAFQAWQSNYFGCTACPQAQPNADPYGKGMSNFNQFLAGLNPTNPASLFQIISTARNTTNVVIVWKAAGIRSNAVQATTGAPDGSYSTNGFADISGPIVLGVPGDTTTNYTDAGGATNVPARYYRIRLLP